MADTGSPFANNTNNNHDTYGAHLLVDFKPIEDADALLSECEQYVEETKAEIFTLPFVPSFSRVAQNIKAWRMKRKDSKLQVTYQSLQPKIATTERTLRKIIGEVVEKKAVLRLQARHLQVRLEKCVDHNKSLLNETDGPLEDTRNFVNTLSGESTVLKDMLNFNIEVLKLKKIEEYNKAQAMMRWGKSRNRNIPEPDLTKDDDHNLLEARLLTFRDLREKFVGYLAYILEKRGVQQSNLDNCLWSLDALKSAVKREGIAPNSPNGGNSSSGGNIDPDAGEEPIIFDHSRCADCSYGYSMACDCMSHLAALQKQAQDANKRLQSLVEIRERMLETMEYFQQEQGNMPPESPEKDVNSAVS